MNADSFFTIGSTHKVCQDYTRHGYEKSRWFAAVSDGCSSSPDTDFGSRLMVVSAIDYYLSRDRLDGELIAIRGHDCVSMFNLCPDSIDATLLFAYFDGDNIKVKAWGDGVVIEKRKSGEIFYHEISCSNGAPSYLSYLLSKSRYERFLQEFGGRRTVKTYLLGNENPLSVSGSDIKDSFGLDFSFVTADTEMVMLCTDGVQSFLDSEFKPIPLSEIVRNMTDIRSFTGEFVKRNTKFFLTRDCKNKGWTHGDDLGVAAIHVE